MKLKNNEEILKMSKAEIIKYKDNALLELQRNVNCSYCSDCSGCSGCSDCSDCSYCSGCSDCYDCSYCSDCYRCSRCSGCSYCSDCYRCYDCYACVNIKDKQYMICNVQFTKDEYEKKMKEM